MTLELPRLLEDVAIGERFLNSDGHFYIKIGEDAAALDWESYLDQEHE